MLGKHTDDAGGRSLLAAVDRGITIALEDADEGIYASTTAVEGELHLAPGTPSGLTKGHWGNYVQATIDRLHLNFGELKPARLIIDSNLPLASGMSSSSALVVAVASRSARLRACAAWARSAARRITRRCCAATSAS